MRILFLSHYFPPEVNAPATRTYEHCKKWVEMGHEVTVISCVPHHPMGEAYPGYLNKLYQTEIKDGIKAIKVLTYITANEGFVKRTFNYVFYMLMAICIAPFIGKADIVISTSPQFFNGLAGYFVSRIKRCPWVLEIRDLWPESILAVGAISNKSVIAFLEKFERFVYRKADLIVVLTDAFRQHVIAHGGTKNRVEVIRNGVDLKFFTAADRDEKYAASLGINGKFVASYVGTHGMAHGLDVVLDAAELLRDEAEIVFLMVGDGAERKRLESEIHRRELTNIVMLGQQSKDSMPKIWSVTDVSLVLLRKLDLFKTVIPSKIFESMAMRKPIVLGVEGEVEGIIRAHGTGLCIEPENAQALAAAIKRLHADSDLATSLGSAGYRCVSQEFSRDVLAVEYENHLSNTISR